MWLLLFPSCRSSQLITVIHISFSLSLSVSSATFVCLYLQFGISSFFFSFLPVLCIYSYFKRPVQQHILYLWVNTFSYLHRSCIDMCIALSNEGVMNRWWCVFLVCWQRQKQELWIASVSVLFGWWSEHILWQIGKGKYSRQWRLRDEAAGGVSPLFLVWDWWEYASKEINWSWIL